MEEFSRTELLIKKEGIEALQNSTVAIFGVGGVGGFVVEALARAGVGTLHIIDHDTVSISNLNRQIIATHQTIDQKKVEVMKERILSINPHCHVLTYDDFFLPETVDYFPFDEFDYIVDAVDTVTAKIKLVEIAQEKKIKIISSMGTGNAPVDPETHKKTPGSITFVPSCAGLIIASVVVRDLLHIK